jgi:hypothetical protein
MSLKAAQHALGRAGTQVGPTSTFPDGTEVLWSFGNMFVRFHGGKVVQVIKNPLPPG